MRKESFQRGPSSFGVTCTEYYSAIFAQMKLNSFYSKSVELRSRAYNLSKPLDICQ